MFFTFNWFELVLTSFLQFFLVPVQYFWILESSRTGPALGPSKNSEKTGPDRTSQL